MINSLLAKGEDMGRWAEKYSITPDAKTGGIMGWIARGQLETVESAVFALPIEKRSGILKSSYGHHIFGDKGRELYFLE